MSLQNSGFASLALLAAGLGCAGSDGKNGLESLIRESNEPAGANCVNGGLKIDFGVDRSADKKLQDSEVSGSTFLCTPIGNVLVTAKTLGLGDSHCPEGGIEVDTGVDKNGDGSLGPGEFTATFVCNGSAGPGGPPGPAPG